MFVFLCLLRHHTGNLDESVFLLYTLKQLNHTHYIITP